MNMAKTRTQFRKQVLWNLNALAAGQEPEAEDAAKVDAGAEAAFAWLEKSDIFGSRYAYENDDIDDAAFMALARFVANEIASAYGTPYSDAARLSAEAGLHRAFSIGPTYSTLAADFF
jgi:hypothetical protein